MLTYTHLHILCMKVPGAWLESHVKKSRDGRYCVGRVLSTGSLWVDRDRLRLVKHVINRDKVEPSTTEIPPQRSPPVAVLDSSPPGGNRRRLLSCLNMEKRSYCSVM